MKLVLDLFSQTIILTTQQTYFSNIYTCAMTNIDILAITTSLKENEMSNEHSVGELMDEDNACCRIRNQSLPLNFHVWNYSSRLLLLLQRNRSFVSWWNEMAIMHFHKVFCICRCSFTAGALEHLPSINLCCSDSNTM